MSWANKAAQQAEQERQREVSKQKEVERQQRDLEAQIEMLAAKLSPMVTSLLEEAGDALFGRVSLLNIKKYTVKRLGAVWQLEPTQGLQHHTTISADETSPGERIRSVDFFCITVTLVADRDQPSLYYFLVDGYVKHDWFSRYYGRNSGSRSAPEPTHATSDISDAGLIAELQKFIYAYKTEMIRLKNLRD